MAPAVTPSPERAATPRRLGRYALLGTVGRGGMGEIVRARAFGAGGATKELCLKRIHADRLARPGALERFVEEARLSLRLAHANIVAVFDFGRAGDEHYLAMEWVDGVDLRALLGDARARAEPLDRAVAAHVAAEIARALAYAHALGVVHCDVKPGNVLIARTGDVKLTDFGVATAARTSGAGGTEGYAAPEQRARGAVTPASDLHALGVLLAEMLLGERPDGASDVVGQVAEPLEGLLVQMLDPEPARRPGDAADVARELERYVARERAARGIAPRDELARRAAELADGRPEERAEGTYEATASWARDGASAFPEATASTQGGGPARPPAAEGGAARGRAIAGAALTLAAIAVAGIGVRLALGPGERGEEARARSRTDAVPVSAPLGTGGVVDDAFVAVASPPVAPTSEAPPPTSAPVDAPSAGPRSEREGRRASSAGRPEAPHGGSTTIQTAAEAPPEPARVRINAIPWAEVELDGRALGTTPLLDVAIPPGRHSLRFVNRPLGVERARELELAPGERRDLVVDLE